MTQLLHILDQLLAEKGNGKGRNLNRSFVLVLCLWTAYQVSEIPSISKRQATADVRLARVEARLGIASTPPDPSAEAGAVSALISSVTNFASLHLNTH